MNLRWAWDDRTRDLFRWVDPDAWDATRHDPVGSSPRSSPNASPPWLRIRPSSGSSARCTTTSALPRGAALVPDPRPRRCSRWPTSRPSSASPRPSPSTPGGLGILAGDHLKSASDLGVPLVGVGLFYRHGYFRQRLSADGWQQERFPDQDPWAMALTLCDDIRVRVELAGTPARGAGVARRRRSGPALPARHRRRGEPARAAGRHRPPLRRRRRAPAPPGDPPRHRRRPGPGGAGHRRPGVPHQRGPRRVPRARADPPDHRRRRPHVRRGLEATRPGRSSPPTPPCPPASTASPRADRALLRRLGRGVRDHRRQTSWRSATAPIDDAATSGSTWRSWACASPGAPTPCPKLHGEVSRDDVRRPVARPPDRRGAHRVGHQRRARGTWVSGRHDRPALPPRPPRLGRGRPRASWAADVDATPTTSCGGSRTRPAPGSWLRAGAGPPAGRWPSGRSVRGGLGRRPARPQRAHHRLRPPLRHLQAGQPAARPGRAPPGAAARRASGRCSSSSPARPTPPTTRARR
jgi:hypothetical protein